MKHVTCSMNRINYKTLIDGLRGLLKDRYFVVIIIFFCVGAALRLYQLTEYATFLGDQGRDAIMIRRILTFEHFPAIGAPTSVGQVYLGPFYYYFIAPWLLLSNFNPVGLAFGVAIISSLFIVVAYFFVASLYGKRIALTTSFLLTFSSSLINLSRFSWNPNVLPLFSLLYILLFIVALREKKSSYYALAGILLSCCIQLHYLSLFLLSPSIILFAVHFKEKMHKGEMLHMLKYMIGAFGLFSIPLIIFDLRHQFLNVKNFISLFVQQSDQSVNILSSYVVTLSELFTFSLGIKFPGVVAGLVMFIFITSAIYFYVKAKDPLIRQISLFAAIQFLSLSLYKGDWLEHYFGFVYPLFYLYIAVVVSTTICTLKYWKYLVGIGAAIYILFQIQNYNFLYESGGRQIETAKKIAQVIFDNAGSSKYRLTSLPERYSESTYRYFLEVWDRRPIEKDSTDYTNTLFVVCENACDPVDDPQWDVAVFAPKKIEGEWRVEGQTIYKLTNLLP